ncbi:MAG: CPBP family intramembrane metalloprotease [Actinobacteria bacterium]|nr:CPBP family intramembrane metalloprotease [Actinomycetota bacterium]MDI6830787.1 CPBP family intramembrane metalloprotease [Actinomycetota bacterium]
MAAKLVATCAYHPGVRAVTRCARCGALICAGCRRVEGNRSWCEACFRDARAGTPGGSGARSRDAGAMYAGVPWKLWPGLAFLPVPFLLNGLMTYMMRQGEEVSVGAAQLLISLLLYSSTLAFAFLVVYRYGNPLEEMRLNGRNLPASLGLGLVGGSLAFWLAVASGLMSAGMFRSLENVERWLQGFFDVNVKELTGADVFIAGLIIIVAAPICEELFFRGYLYPAMRDRMGLWGAAFLNGFLFSAVHFSVFGLIGRTLAGVIFCLLYEYNDNLWSPITAHALNNFVAFFLPLVVIWGS